MNHRFASIVVGVFVAILALACSALLAFVVPRASDPAAASTPQHAGAVLSGPELDARSRGANIALENARLKFETHGVGAIFVQRLRFYFFFLGPIALTGLVVWRRRSTVGQLTLAVSPILLALSVLIPL